MRTMAYSAPNPVTKSATSRERRSTIAATGNSAAGIESATKMASHGI